MRARACDQSAPSRYPMPPQVSRQIGEAWPQAACQRQGRSAALDAASRDQPTTTPEATKGDTAPADEGRRTRASVGRTAGVEASGGTAAATEANQHTLALAAAAATAAAAAAAAATAAAAAASQQRQRRACICWRHESADAHRAGRSTTTAGAASGGGS